ncbi:MAG: Spy/CpxP family protein refolding chaperone [Pseudomonadota bacterium]
MRRLLFALLLPCFGLPAMAQHNPAAHAAHLAGTSTTSPYADMVGRPIKALSKEQIDDLQAGEGMGMSLPAELNAVPGPVHALEMTDELRLTREQVHKLDAIVKAMRADAIRLGGNLIDAERQLDTGFKTRAIDAAAIESQSERIGLLNGKLRAVHLKAHLQASALLTPDQVARYQRARGYSR